MPFPFSIISASLKFRNFDNFAKMNIIRYATTEIHHNITKRLHLSCGGRIDPALSKAEGLVSAHPDSALATLENIAMRKGLSQEQLARCGKALALASLRLGRSFATDSLLDESIRYFRMVGDTATLTETYQAAAFRARWRGQRDSAAYYLMEAIRLLPEVKSDELASLYLRLSSYYDEPIASKDYPKAIEYARKAAAIAQSDKMRSLALQDIGVCLSFLGQQDSALYYSTKSIETVMNAESKPADYPTFITNYANLSGADLALSRKLLHSLPPNYSIAKFISLGYLYLNAARTDSASFYLNKAMEEYHRLSGAISINTGNNLYALKMCLDHSQGRHVIAGENVTANDSINRVVEMQRMLNAELDHSRGKLQQHLVEERISRQRSVTLLIVVIFIGMTIFFLYDRNAKKKYISLRKQLDRSRVNQILSESQTDEATDIAKVWAGRFNLCLQGFSGTEWMKRLQVLDGQESSEYLPSESRDRLSSALMEYFTDVIVDLKANGTGLTVDDIILCLLTLLGLKNQTISRCTAASEGAVRTRKSRLKGKLTPKMFSFIFK